MLFNQGDLFSKKNADINKGPAKKNNLKSLKTTTNCKNN